MTSDENLQWFDAFLARRAAWSPDERAAYAEMRTKVLAIAKESDERQAEFAREGKRREIQFEIDRVEREKAVAAARAETERAALVSKLASV